MEGTTQVLSSALEAARAEGISTIVVASTTGRTAQEMCSLAKGTGVRVVVVAFSLKPGVTKNPFPVLEELDKSGEIIFRQRPRMRSPGIFHRLIKKLSLSTWQRHLKAVKSIHGIGICVCHKILWMVIKAGLVESGRIIAVAGAKRGADSAGVFTISEGKKWPVLCKVIVSQGSVS